MRVNIFPKRTKRLLRRGLFYGLVIAVAWGLKWHYSRAGSSDLDWILRPTAAVVAIFSDGQWVKESGAGYHNREHMATIAPACAGVNFMISAWCMSAFLVLPRQHTVPRRAAALVACLAGAYLLTIAANSIRVVVSLRLYQMDIYAGWITPARLHRIAGIVIYLSALCLAFLCLHNRRELRPSTATLTTATCTPFALRGKGWVPLFWYFAVALGIPLVNRAYRRQPDQFIEHTGFLLGTGLLVFAAVFLLPYGLKSALKRLPATLFQSENRHAPQNSDR